MTQAPIVVEVRRSGVVESVHRGLAVVVDETGSVVRAWGDAQTPIYPRSAVKPLQAAGMLAAGLDIGGSWLALACASHSGEPFHLAAVEQMLASVDLTVADLQCPPDWPLGADAMRAYAAAGSVPARVAMNCSGKHAGMLMTCVARGWPVDSYLDPAHPLQVALRATVETVAGPVAMTSTDGCGAPLWGVPLVGLARGFLTLPEPIMAAMRGYPDFVGGTTRDVSQLMRGLPGVVTKDGAEAVQAMRVSVGGRRYAVALKISDGSDRARSVVAAGILRWLGLDAPVLADLEKVAILGGGRPVGEMRLSEGFFGSQAAM